ncbi:universal stress protein [Olleya namhaensis]|uniref:universal stress protein n=1 Tax=Olleya namhaensis TaxID=1144750 RepID=UPI00232DC413|nr:universal stress protein [Olleya namhaensis]
MKSILLPTDFSENSWNAIEYILNFFSNTTCTFYLLHVNPLTEVAINNIDYNVSQTLIEDVFTKPAKKQLTVLLKKIARYFPNNPNHSFYTINTTDFFIDAVRNQVTEKKIDLIVMGTKGASGLEKLIIGSNTADIITKVKCNTLIVPENAKFKTLSQIAFPTDFLQFYGVTTLKPIVEILENFEASLRVLHITKKDIKLNSDQEKNKEFLEDYFTNNNHSFHYLTNTKIEAAIQCFVESRNIDMIAMVAKNLNYFQQILFHSKVEEISYQTDVPFLVLHE